MGWIFKDEPASPADYKTARKRATWLSIPFALMGLFALVLLLHDGLLPVFHENPHWGLDRQKTFGLLSAIIASGGFVALIFGINAKKQVLHGPKQKSLVSENVEKPWLARKDWASGHFASGARKPIILLWVFVIFWLVVSIVITLLVVPQELHNGNHTALVALIFPVIGLVVLGFAANTTFAWRRYGQSVFDMAAMPGALGGTLEGMIRVKTRLQPEHGLHLRLSCFRRTTTGAGKNRSTAEKILWQDEKWLRPDLPQTDVNATGIPVYFQLPADQPESAVDIGDGIHWKLEASAKVRGPNYHANFEVPVFRLPEAPTPGDDPTVQYQMSLDEIRQQIHSHIQVNDLSDGGREFIFPAARNRGFASGATAFLLIWTIAIIFLIWKHAPPLLPLVFGAIDLLMAAFAFDLWFRRSRVVVTAAKLQIETAWLSFKKQQTLKVSEVANIAADVGATAGHVAYYDLRIQTRDRREITIAKNLASKPEADWLVRQMVTAVKNSP
ncbi:MAG TPA: hypothetical protein VMA13_05835 [Candidatus Saccharimonadales bacterium]|nr:hypothetical protein [Candidatus Saccharimonadales bacterium]